LAICARLSKVQAIRVAWLASEPSSMRLGSRRRRRATVDDVTDVVLRAFVEAAAQAADDFPGAQ
jgi:hypothetical protein